MTSRNPSTPRDVIATAIALKDHLDFRGVVTLCDIESMKSVQRDFLRTMAPPTERECREEYPDFSDEEIANVLEKLSARHRQYALRLDELLPSTANFEEAASLEAAAFFERLLKGSSEPRTVALRRILARGQRAPAWLFEPPVNVRYEILLPELIESRIMRVPYRQLIEGNGSLTRGEEEFEHVREVSPGSWKILARRGLLESRGSSASVITPALRKLIEM